MNSAQKLGACGSVCDVQIFWRKVLENICAIKSTLVHLKEIMLNKKKYYKKDIQKYVITQNKYETIH